MTIDRVSAWSVGILSQRNALITAFAGLAVVLFTAAMAAGIDYDEEAYIAGAYFARDLVPYRDFISFQPPPYTWIVSAAFDVIGGWYLLVARLITWILGVASCLLLFSLLRSMGTSSLVAFVLVLAFVASPFLRGPLAGTRNDLMPLFFMLVALRLFVEADGELSRGKHRLLWSGIFLSLAAATKYSYVFAAPIAFLVLLYDQFVYRGEKSSSLVHSPILWFVMGATAGMLPLAYAVAVHGERFVFMTLRFHQTAVFDWYRSQGLGEMLTLEHKLKLLPRELVRHGNATILLILAASAMALLFGKSTAGGRRRLAEPLHVALIGLIVGATLIAIMVGPLRMYYAPVAALAVLIAGRAWAIAGPSIPRWGVATILVLSILPAFTAFERYGRQFMRGLDPERWVGVQAHRSAVRISGILAQNGASGHVATLFPTIVLDSNRVLREFAAGPFFYRSADLYPPSRVAELHGVGPATLDALFAHSPPAAIVAGFGPFPMFNDMDAALVDYARRSGYVNVHSDWRAGGYRNGQVWVRPASR